MPNLTPNYSFNQPLVNDPIDEDLWGGQLNENWGSIDSLLLTATNDLNNAIDFADSPYTLLDTDQNKVLSVDASGGSVVIDLLSGSAAGDGYKVSIKKVDSSSNSVTINGNIDGGSSTVLPSENDVITIVSDGTDWVSLTGVQPSVITPSVDIDFADSPFSVSSDDQNKILLVDASGGSVNVNLLEAAVAGDGYELIIKKVDATANTVSINGFAAETIDGLNTQVLSREFEVIHMICDGSTWNSVTNLDYVDDSQVGVGPNLIVQFDGSTRYPSADGSQITNITLDAPTLQRNSFSGATTSSFTGLSSTYDAYTFWVYISSGTNSQIFVDFSSNNGGSWVTNTLRSVYVGTSSFTSNSSQASITGPSGVNPLSSTVEVYFPTNSTATTATFLTANLGTGAASPRSFSGGFSTNGSLAVNGVRFRKASGTMTGEILMAGQRTI